MIRVRADLIDTIFKAQCPVCREFSLLLDTKDGSQVEPLRRAMVIGTLSWWASKALVQVVIEPALQHLVGLVDAAYLFEQKLVYKSILIHFVCSFNASFGLGRVGTNYLYPQQLAGTPKLRQALAPFDSCVLGVLFRRDEYILLVYV